MRYDPLPPSHAGTRFLSGGSYDEWYGRDQQLDVLAHRFMDIVGVAERSHAGERGLPKVHYAASEGAGVDDPRSSAVFLADEADRYGGRAGDSNGVIVREAGASRLASGQQRVDAGKRVEA